ncbi:MAG: DEAD/DEAH box helicase family protein [Deltaproteobacteria bacterium]|nr:DEAD/DEAH box helicase family protein [Deltaproteobacteria bacterium]
MEKEMMRELEKALQEIERLRQENAQLRKKLGMEVSEPKADYNQSGLSSVGLDSRGEETQEVKSYGGHGLSTSARSPRTDPNFSTQEKIKLFRALFRGREDIYAVFWFNERTGKKGYSPACEDPWSSGKGKPKKYFPLTDEVILSHLSGERIIGVYPLLRDDTCWFLACDFDKEGWALDASAFLHICNDYGVPAYLERSRSGNGGHVWIFFSAPVSATSARQLGIRLLKETMVLRAEMDLASYDRFFPSQDFLPRAGFGNLIALPLQKKCRALGNTEFLNPDDPKLRPWLDQWQFLSQIKRLGLSQVEVLLQKIPPVSVGPGKPGTVSPAIRKRYPAPKQIRCSLGAALSIEKSGIPPWSLAQIKQLALLHNPQFYEREKLRLSTWRIPRFIKCYEEDASHIHLPRGTLDELKDMAKGAGSELSLTDQRLVPEKLALKFLGSLMPPQMKAVEAVLRCDMGVLIAPPGAGKTVMGCYAIARRNVPTLILAHRKPILEQWRAQLGELLGLSSRLVGQVGGGRNRQSGMIDLGMMQSLKRFEDLEAFFSKYGFIVVDECHHLPAFTFEACVKRAPVRYILGLTATPYRRDGLQDIIVLQCGPIRHTMEPIESSFSRTLLVRETSFTYSGAGDPPIQEIFRCLVRDDARNELIRTDVCQALAEGRRCLILSHWKEHCELLADGLRERGKTPLVLSGTLGKKTRSAMLGSLQDIPSDKELLIIATGQYLGEGFDCPEVDTLFLVFPLSFKGKLVQYVGRALRSHEEKSSVRVYDYVDTQMPILRKMYAKRQKTYRSLRFAPENAQTRESSKKTFDTAEMPAGLFSSGS